MGQAATALHSPEDIEWAMKTHAKTITGNYGFAILYGNEDCPQKIEFWRDINPNVDQPADVTWIAETVA